MFNNVYSLHGILFPNNGNNGLYSVLRSSTVGQNSQAAIDHVDQPEYQFKREVSGRQLGDLIIFTIPAQLQKNLHRFSSGCIIRKRILANHHFDPTVISKPVSPGTRRKDRIEKS